MPLPYRLTITLTAHGIINCSAFYFLCLFHPDSTVKESEISKSDEQDDDDEEGKKKVAEETTSSGEEKVAPSGEGGEGGSENPDESVVSAQGGLK